MSSISEEINKWSAPFKSMETLATHTHQQLQSLLPDSLHPIFAKVLPTPPPPNNQKKNPQEVEETLEHKIEYRNMRQVYIMTAKFGGKLKSYTQEYSTRRKKRKFLSAS